MHDRLISEAFAKAESQLKKENGIKPTMTKCADRLSLFLDEKGYSYSAKSLINAFKEAKSNPEMKIKQPQVVQWLSYYLGYEDYVGYVNNVRAQPDDVKMEETEPSDVEREKENVGTEKSPSRAHHKFLLMGTVVVAIIALITALYLYTQRQRWMQWKEDHYEEVDFSASALKSGNLVVYEEVKMQRFKKISAHCETTFFTPSGKVMIWYGKNGEKEIECFSNHGLHPETGKPLKPITSYIIEKYICNGEP
jgi:hypothetical protein